MKEKTEFLFKVLVIGDLGTGKTSIIKRYVHQFFSIHYRATVSLVICLVFCMVINTAVDIYNLRYIVHLFITSLRAFKCYLLLIVVFDMH